MLLIVRTKLPTLMHSTYLDNQGYRAARFERKRLMIAFFVFLAAFIAGFGMMFVFSAFRFMWVQWPFFACVSGMSCVQLVVCLAFAVVCRVHFGQGLSHYRKRRISRIVASRH